MNNEAHGKHGCSPSYNNMDLPNYVVSMSYKELYTCFDVDF
jgi:hypothetical protein